MDPGEDLLDVHEAAALLGLRPRSVYDISLERLPRYRMGAKGGAIRYSRADLLASGADLYTISKILGHSSVQVTQRYSHMQTDAQRDALQRAFG